MNRLTAIVGAVQAEKRLDSLTEPVLCRVITVGSSDLFLLHGISQFLRK